jgi:hypothetical protein
MGKGSQRRPTAITFYEERLRWLLATGEITFKEFEKRYKELKQQGKIYRRF